MSMPQVEAQGFTIANVAVDEGTAERASLAGPLATVCAEQYLNSLDFVRIHHGGKLATIGALQPEELVDVTKALNLYRDDSVSPLKVGATAA